MSWWKHSQLTYRKPESKAEPGSCSNSQKNHLAELHLADVSLLRWAKRSTATPFYIYSGRRIKEKIASLKNALQSVTNNHRMFFAMKANRNPQILAEMRNSGLGIDTCSGMEILLALKSGFRPSQISFTSAAITADDLRILCANPEIHLNLDSIAQIKLVAEHSPGRSVGLRINPQAGYGYSSSLEYSTTNQVTKFGIYESEFSLAARLAIEHGLRITGLHCHSGWGLQNRQMASVAKVMKRINDFAKLLNEVQEGPQSLGYINIGGGLGSPMSCADTPLNLQDWASTLRECLLPCFGPGTELFSEPGDFLTRDSGLLITRVLGVETKNAVNFIVVDASFAVNLQHASYQLPLEALPLVQPAEGCILEHSKNQIDRFQNYRVVGAINEAVDVFIQEIRLPEIRTGEFLAFPAVGAYGATMASNHCLRGQFEEYFIAD